MSAPLPDVTPLCIADPSTFWPWRRWPEFFRWPDPANTTVIVPLAGMADWGLGHPLDAEEMVLMQVLRTASQARPASRSLAVMPPGRFILGPDSGCAFAVDPPVAHSMLAEVAGSIAASGFKRVVFYNASPWNEELIAAAARDQRVANAIPEVCPAARGSGKLVKIGSARCAYATSLRDAPARRPASA